MNLLPAGIVHQATGDISDRWYGQQAVYRLSMGNFVSCAIHCACTMMVLLACVASLIGPADTLAMRQCISPDFTLIHAARVHAALVWVMRPESTA